ncbi:GntR family transcriptional regulator [Streptomyces sp. BI20]|uniref:GntR family transcriptional regulator n=1 Tax=Streptomyces sp. BI20 TaxID=3403460 RepID=UPI003C78E6E6
MPRDTAYMKVADALRDRVQAGEWKVGERLPSRSRFAEEYGVGQSIAQRAMERLIIDGLLEGRAGSGTYVRRPRERLRMFRSRGRGLSGPFHAGKAVRAESHSRARVPAPEHIAHRLAIATGDPCVVTHYEFLADGRPVEIAESWEPMAITDGTPVVLPEMGVLKGAGVIKRMRSLGIAVTRVLEVPRPARADQRAANLLGISVGDLVTRIERTHYDKGGRPVETADLVVADRRAELAYETTIKD